jgi:hypothetical protein
VGKVSDTLWLVIGALLGVTGLALVVSLLMGRPHSMNVIGKALVTFIGFAALNGAYISFKVAMTGLDPDTRTTYTPVTRVLMGGSGILVVALVWGGLWILH